MGVDKTTYLMLCIDLTKEQCDVWDDKLRPYIEGHKDHAPFQIIYDCMNDNYIRFGIVYASDSNWDGVDEVINIDETLLENKLLVMDEAKELFGVEVEPVLRLFSHYS